MLLGIKKVDLFRKISADFSTQTLAGGILSLFSFTIIFFLFTYELYSYFFSPYVPSLIIEPSSSNRIQVNVNINFPRLPCGLLTIAYSDISSEYFTQAYLHKYPIENGQILYDAHMAHTDPITPKGCGSCYGAELYDGQCCNTCEEVMEAYTSMGWGPPDAEKVVQCQHKSSENTFRGEGCLVIGEILTRKIPATIRFQLNTLGVAIMNQFPYSFNGDHTINHFGFSEPGVANSVGPLDGRSNNGHYVTLYSMKVTSAIKDGFRYYELSDGYISFEKMTYPVIAINYDIEPITTVYKPPKSFAEFLVSICAIIGGWSAVSLIISKIIIK